MAKDVFITPDSGTIEFKDSGNLIHIISGSGDTLLLSGSKIEMQGFVGIGTTDPLQALDVQGGNINVVAGNYYRIGYNTVINQVSNEILVGYHEGSKLTYTAYQNSGGGNFMRFVVSGSELVRFANTNAVGIGTTTPEELLHVWSNISASAYYGDGSNLTGMGGVGGYWTGSGGDIHRMSNVGIGTNNPSNIFHTSASAGMRVETSAGSGDIIIGGWASAGLYSDAGNVGLRAPSGGKTFLTTYNAAARDGLTINNSANVGIGSSSPTVKLEVHGDALITGSLTVEGILTAEEFHTEFVSASIIFSSGSTKFGDSADDIHQFTGSIRQSGSTSYFMNDVGIGTVSPSQKIHIYDLASNTPGFAIQTDGTNFMKFAVGTVGNVVFYEDSTYLTITPGDTINDVTTDWTKATRFDGTGNVGIGNSSLATTGLHVWNNISSSINYANRFVMAAGAQGTAGASLRYIGNANTINDLWYNVPAGGQHRFAENDVEVVLIQSEGIQADGYLHIDGAADSYLLGFVGIGTTNPTETLHIYEDGGLNVEVLIEDTAHNAYLTMKRGTFSSRLIQTSPDFFISSSGDLILQALNVGINTSSPVDTLHVWGNVTASAYYGDGSNLSNLPSGGGSGFWTTGSNTLYPITLADDVGIGTASPVDKLHVWGNVTASNYYGNGSNLTGLTGLGGFWTGSTDYISREGDVQITGSVDISGSLEVRVGGTANEAFIVEKLTSGYPLIKSSAGDLFIDDTQMWGHLEPASNNSKNLGISAKRWATFWSKNLIDNGTNVQITGSTVISSSLNIIGSVSASSFRITGSTGYVGIGTSAKYPLHLYSSGSTVFSIEGSQGTLFQVRDSFEGTLFEINDISGIPILEVKDTDTVSMGTYGKNALVVTGSKVGIGTSDPAISQTSSLHIWGDVSASTYYGDGSNLTNITASEVPADIILSASIWQRNGNDVFLNNTTDIVGIGTLNPAYGLDVYKTTFYFHNASGAVIYSTGNKVNIGSSATPANKLSVIGAVSVGSSFNVTAPTNGLIVEGDVGIGTTTPSAKLDVQGDAFITGILTAQEVHTDFVSASIIYATGSTKFGDSSDDIHQFTGSIQQSGSDVYNRLEATEFQAGTSTIKFTGTTSRLVGSPTIESPSTLYLQGTAIQLRSNTYPHNDLGIELGLTTRRWEKFYSAKISDTGTYVGIGTLTPVDLLHVWGNVTASAFYGDGSNLINLPSEGLWTSSVDYISRESDVQITGSLNVSGSGSFGYLEIAGDTISAETGSFSYVSSSVYYGDGSQLTGISAGSGRWTGSDGFISHFGNVQITGTLDVSSDVTANAYYGDGSNLSGISATNWISSSGVLYPGSLTDSVGIGITNPQTNLHIQSTGDTSSIMLASEGTTGGAAMILLAEDSITPDGMSISYYGSPNLLKIQTHDNSVAPTLFDLMTMERDTGNTRFLNWVSASTYYGDGSNLTGISATGKWSGTGVLYPTTITDKIGIGTTTPQARLHIYDAGDPSIILDTGGTDWTLGVDDSIGDRFFICPESGSTAENPHGFYDGIFIIATGTTKGYVGIGTTSPGTALQIVDNYSLTASLRLCPGSQSAAARIFLAENRWATGHMSIAYYGDPNQLQIQNDDDEVLMSMDWLDGATIFSSSVTADSFIGDGSGITGVVAAGVWESSSGYIYPGSLTDRVGIGTATPQARFHIYDAGDPSILFDTNGIDWTIGIDDSVSDRFFICPGSGSNANDAYHMGIFIRRTDGSVGFGTTSPGAQLHIVANEDTASIIIAPSSQSKASRLILSENQWGTGHMSIAYYGIANQLQIQNDNDEVLMTMDWLDGATIFSSSVTADSFIGDGSQITGVTAEGAWESSSGYIYPGSLTDRVGIGTATPQASFHIYDAGDPSIILDTGGTDWTIGIDDSVSDRFFICPGSGSNLGDAFPVAFLINENGNVGIGTISPSATLHVVDVNTNPNTGSIIIAPSASAGASRLILAENRWGTGHMSIGYYGEDDLLKIQKDNLDVLMTMEKLSGDTFFSGSVGIGTDNFSYKLEVLGDVSASTYYGDGSNLTGITSGYWTGSTDYINRESDVKITGSLYVTGSQFVMDIGGSSNGKFIVERLTVGYPYIRANSGDLFIGSAQMFGNLEPSGNNSRELGVAGKRWKIFHSMNISDLGAGLGVGIGTTNPTVKLDVHGDALITGSLTVEGIITAEEFHTEFVSASIIFSSGSTKFGDSIDDIHQFTGSIHQSGSGATSYFMDKVGIGTTSPDSTLHVWGDVSASNYIMSNTGALWLNDDTDPSMRIGRDMVPCSNEILSSVTMQFMCWSSATQGFQFINKLSQSLWELDALNGTVYNHGDLQVTGSITTNKIVVPADDGQIWFNSATDPYWRMGRNIVPATGEVLTSNTLQLMTYSGATEGFQFVNRLSASLWEIRGSDGDVFSHGHLSISSSKAIYKQLSNDVYVAQPGGGFWNSNASSANDYVKIALPVTLAGLIHFTVDVYDYGVDTVATYHIGGYSSTWQSTKVSSARSQGNTDEVRLGTESGKSCVWIGKSGRVNWDRVHVIVRDVHASFTGATAANWADGWVISTASSLGTVNVTYESPDLVDYVSVSGGTFYGDVILSGSVGTGASASISSTYDLYTNGDIGATGDITANVSSDIRLKDNRKILTNALDRIDLINGIEFDWNDKSPKWAIEKGHDVGLIAQEVEKVLPEVVTTRENGYKTIDYAKVTSLLVQAIKEEKEERLKLEKRIIALEKK